MVARLNLIPDGKKWLLDWNNAHDDKAPTIRITPSPIHVTGFFGILLPFIFLNCEDYTLKLCNKSTLPNILSIKPVLRQDRVFATFGPGGRTPELWLKSKLKHLSLLKPN